MPIFMKYDGVDGDVTVQGYEKWIQVESFSWNATRDVNGASADQVHIVASCLKGAPLLLRELVEGRIARQVVIAVTSGIRDTVPGSQPVVRYTLSNVQITSFSPSHSGGEERAPVEQLSLNFTEIEYRVNFETDRGNGLNQTYTWELPNGRGR